MTQRLPIRALLLGLATLPLAACVSFGPKPPASLLTLSTAQLAAPAPRTAQDGTAVQVTVPSAPQELSALRIPVRTSPNEIAYIKDAVWADTPTRLFRNLVAETIGSVTGRVVLEARGADVTPGVRIGGRLVNFGLDAPSHMAVVTFDATKSRRKEEQVSTRRFEARVQASAETGPTVAAALSQGANQVAQDIAAWVQE